MTTIIEKITLRLGYAKITKGSQGTTRERCAFGLREQDYSHGQLYVSSSRVRTTKDIMKVHYLNI